MEDSSPMCRYCNLMYSRINEPIFIVCVCANQAKFAHGSCFRNWQKYHKYGVCKVCLTKTMIIQDGRKSLRETIIPDVKKKVVILIALSAILLIAILAFLMWMLIEQCWQLYCIVIISIISFIFLITLIMCGLSKDTRKFWTNFSEQNHHWKVVYCFEEQKLNGKGVSRRYSDVPLTLPHDDYNNVNTSYHGFDDGTNDFSGMVDIKKDVASRQNDRSVYPSVWAPRNYPYVKKNPVYDKDVVTSSKPRPRENNHLPLTDMEINGNSHLSHKVDPYQPSGDSYVMSRHSNRSSVNSNYNYNGPYIPDNRRSQKESSERKWAVDRKYEHGPVQPSHKPQVKVEYAGKIRSDSQTSMGGSRKTSKQSEILYIDQRADSFYKRADERMELLKYREIFQSHTYLPKTSMGGTPLFRKKGAVLPRASSEPDFRKSKPDLPYNHFSELFRRSRDASPGPKSKSKQSLNDSITGRFRLKSNPSSEYKTSAMPHESDIEFKSAEPQPLVDVLRSHERSNKKISRDNRRNQSDYNKPAVLESFPVARSRSMYLPQDPYVDRGDSKINLVVSKPNAGVIMSTLNPIMHKSRSEPSVYLVRSNQSNELPAQRFERSAVNTDAITSSEKLKYALKNKIEETTGQRDYRESEKSNFVVEVHSSESRSQERNEIKYTNDLQPFMKADKRDERRNSKSKEKRKSSNSEKKGQRRNSNSENKGQKKNIKSNFDGQRQNVQRTSDDENKKEIERIMSTPLHQLDMNELFDQTNLVGGKKRATILQPRMTMTSPFFAPTS